MTDYNKIIKLLLECSPWPWRYDRNWFITGRDHNWDTYQPMGGIINGKPHNQGDIVCQVDGPRKMFTESKSNHALISLAPQVIGELVEQVVEMNTVAIGMLDKKGFSSALAETLKQLSIDPDLYRQLKERMEAPK